MREIPDSSPAVAPLVTAGLLLVAREHQLKLGLPVSTVEEIIAATGATRSSAYEAKARVAAALPSLVRPVGRPVAPAAPPCAPDNPLGKKALRFLMDHPGAIYGGPQRRHYAGTFRRFVLDLHDQHPAVDAEHLAEAIEVPVETLRDWLRAGARPEVERTACDPAEWKTSNLHIQTVLTQWAGWEGGFVPFCEHIRDHFRVPFGRTVIGKILEAHGVRLRRRRPGRSPAEKALRQSFEVFFPGAQWVADGKSVWVSVLGRRFCFNFELTVDACSGAFTGVSIRDEEDSAALTEAVDDGTATTGEKPLSVLVDNRPSNLTPEVHQALGDATLLINAAPGRPQTKGHVEGAFGLFSQVVPLIDFTATTKREAARELLRLVVTTWGRTLNHRPRTDRGGKSRVQLYAENPPTPEQIAQARAELEERQLRQQAQRRTLQARQDPVVRQLIAEAFARFGIIDPDGHQLDAIAGFPLDAVVNGITIFDTKRRLGSLPRDLDLPGRYLLGIVRNLAQNRESELLIDAMLRARLEAQDRLLAPLVLSHRALEQERKGPSETLARLVDNALGTDRQLDRFYWLAAAGDLIRAASTADRPDLFRRGARRVHAATQVTYTERLRATRWLAHKALPLA